MMTKHQKTVISFPQRSSDSQLFDPIPNVNPEYFYLRTKAGEHRVLLYPCPSRSQRNDITDSSSNSRTHNYDSVQVLGQDPAHHPVSAGIQQHKLLRKWLWGFYFQDERVPRGNWSEDNGVCARTEPSYHLLGHVLRAIAGMATHSLLGYMKHPHLQKYGQNSLLLLPLEHRGGKNIKQTRYEYLSFPKLTILQIVEVKS